MIVVPHHVKAQIVYIKEIQKSVMKELVILLGPGMHRLILEP